MAQTELTKLNKSTTYVSVGMAIAVLGGMFGASKWVSDSIAKVGDKHAEQLTRNSKQLTEISHDSAMRFQKLEMQLHAISVASSDRWTRSNEEGIWALFFARNPDLRLVDPDEVK